MNDPHREFCRQQHRFVANYLAAVAWVNDLECIVVERRDLEALCGLERFKQERVKWFRDDVAEWFPYVHPIHFANKEYSVGTMYLSRKPIEDFIPDGTLSAERRIALTPPESPKTGLFTTLLGKNRKVARNDIISMMTLLANGLKAPDEIKAEVKPEVRTRTRIKFELRKSA